MPELTRGAHETVVERTALTGADGADVPVIHAAPSGERAAAGVVVHPDIMGVRPLFDDLCSRVASHGYAVACPEPFAARHPRCAPPMIRWPAWPWCATSTTICSSTTWRVLRTSSWIATVSTACT